MRGVHFSTHFKIRELAGHRGRLRVLGDTLHRSKEEPLPNKGACTLPRYTKTRSRCAGR